MPVAWTQATIDKIQKTYFQEWKLKLTDFFNVKHHIICNNVHILIMMHEQLFATTQGNLDFISKCSWHFACIVWICF